MFNIIFEAYSEAKTLNKTGKILEISSHNACKCAHEMGINHLLAA